jgi:hypothetical protein
MSRIENHDARAWRARAEECRAIADTFENPETRAKMYLVAEDYERMAESAERRARESAIGTASPGEIARARNVGAAAD